MHASAFNVYAYPLSILEVLAGSFLSSPDIGFQEWGCDLNELPSPLHRMGCWFFFTK